MVLRQRSFHSTSEEDTPSDVLVSSSSSHHYNNNDNNDDNNNMTGTGSIQLNLVEHDQTKHPTGEEVFEERKRRQFGCCGKLETDQERCHRMASAYQSKFKDIPALPSTEFLLNRHQSHPNNYTEDSVIVLVDCRFEPERQVSMISGAVSLQDFEQNSVSTLSPDTHVITYCTIGYRSGMEARRLKHTYGLNHVSNLDGIVAYSHALRRVEQQQQQEQQQEGASKNNNNNNNTTRTTVAPQIIDPSTGKETKDIHIFGQQWDCVEQQYHPRAFPFFQFVWHTLQVGGTLCIRTGQRISHTMKKCCVPQQH